jgi:hypothetical protein
MHSTVMGAVRRDGACPTAVHVRTRGRASIHRLALVPAPLRRGHEALAGRGLRWSRRVGETLPRGEDVRAEVAECH